MYQQDKSLMWTLLLSKYLYPVSPENRLVEFHYAQKSILSDLRNLDYWRLAAGGWVIYNIPKLCEVSGVKLNSLKPE